MPNITGSGGVKDTVPKFNTATSVVNSAIVEVGGKVGIGVPSVPGPTETIEVNGTVRLGGSAAIPGIQIDTAGNVGLGTASPGAPLEVTNGTGVTALRLSGVNPGGEGGRLEWWSAYAGGKVTGKMWSSAAGPYGGDFHLQLLDQVLAPPERLTERLTILNDGNVGIGTTSPLQRLHVEGSILAYNVAVPCSKRSKVNAQPIVGALGKVKRLTGVSFDWMASGKHDIGLLAEDVGQVIPEAVLYEQNGTNAVGLDYSRLVAVLVEALKEQQLQIEELKAVAQAEA